MIYYLIIYYLRATPAKNLRKLKIENRFSFLRIPHIKNRLKKKFQQVRSYFNASCRRRKKSSKQGAKKRPKN